MLPPPSLLPPLPPLPALPGLPSTLPPPPTMAREPPPMEEPQCTVYVNHLVQRGLSVDVIKDELRPLFETCGTVLDVHAIKHYRTRGQAWVIFDSVESATKAIETLNGHVFHGRAFQCNFARNKSDLLSRADGTYVDKRKKRKRDETEGAASSIQEGGGKQIRAPPKHVERVAPHRILFAYELPEDCTKEKLEELFSPLTGFKEIRFLANRNVAFVEFLDVPTASYALSMLKSHRLTPQHALRLNFAKQ